MSTVTATKQKGQRVLEFIQAELKGFNLPPSTIGLLTSYVLVEQAIRPDMDDSQVGKIFDERSEDIGKVIERRIERSYEASGPNGKTFYEKGALQGLANLQKVE